MSIDFSPLNKTDIYQGAIDSIARNWNSIKDREQRERAIQAQSTAALMNAQTGQDANLVRAQEVQQQNALGQGRLANESQQNDISQQLANQQGQYQQGMLSNEQNSQALQAQGMQQNADLAQQRMAAEQGMAQDTNALRAQELAQTGQYQQGQLGIQQQNADTSQAEAGIKMQEAQQKQQQQQALQKAAQGGIEGIKRFYLSQGLGKEYLDLKQGEQSIDNGWLQGHKYLLEINDKEKQEKAGYAAGIMAPKIMAITAMQDGPEKDRAIQEAAEESDKRFGTDLAKLPTHIQETLMTLKVSQNYEDLQHLVKGGGEAMKAGANILSQFGMAVNEGPIPAGSMVKDPKTGELKQGLTPKTLTYQQKETIDSQKALNDLGDAIKSTQPGLAGPGGRFRSLYLAGKGLIGGLIGLKLNPEQKEFMDKRNEMFDNVKKALYGVDEINKSDHKETDKFIEKARLGELSKDAFLSRITGAQKSLQSEVDDNERRMQGGGLNLGTTSPQGSATPTTNQTITPEMAAEILRQRGVQGY